MNLTMMGFIDPPEVKLNQIFEKEHELNQDLNLMVC